MVLTINNRSKNINSKYLNKLNKIHNNKLPLLIIAIIAIMIKSVLAGNRYYKRYNFLYIFLYVRIVEMFGYVKFIVIRLL